MYSFLGAMIFPPSVSFADFKVCNHTKNLVSIAIGYPSSKGGWVTEGWWHVLPDSSSKDCAFPLKGRLESRYYYLYAEDMARREHWRGDIQMCIGQHEFKILGIEDCYARGYSKVGFIEYDTGIEEDWTVDLTESSAS
ncbi:DUF1036 domain-containing protein [Candidatus Liberibacter sp.]|uniref:DUF1036 domain-containing protein n=1 Tax=Candidatus Liberibacter sp. TaxID=34022 RepID=UPI0015F7245E|nr:DUF1036 domain-containing protein [Candidatus Liberibacter sp.]